MSMQPNESLVFLAAITIMTSLNRDGRFYTLEESVKIARGLLKQFHEKHRRHDADVLPVSDDPVMTPKSNPRKFGYELREREE